jgi:phosphoribosylformimino-5-aminoimidazole carboxamide ribotide isomerase
VELYPAIDIQGGRGVRLLRGEFADETVYGDPLELALAYGAAGARWLHVVDLDAARTGEPVNGATVAAIAAGVAVPVQVGGGIRDERAVERALSAGAARVVLGTAAVEDPGFAAKMAARFPGRVAVGLDYKTSGERREVAVRGWVSGSGRDAGELLALLEESGVAAAVLTDISRDGALAGPDLAGMATFLAGTRLPLIASGGVRSAADLEALAALSAGAGETGEAGSNDAGSNDADTRRLAGAIVGKALLSGALPLEEAIAACER